MNGNCRDFYLKKPLFQQKVEEASDLPSHLRMHRPGDFLEGGQLRLHCRRSADRKQTFPAVLSVKQETLHPLQRLPR